VPVQGWPFSLESVETVAWLGASSLGGSGAHADRAIAASRAGIGVHGLNELRRPVMYISWIL
jgi:hypothetical protein